MTLPVVEFEDLCFFLGIQAVLCLTDTACFQGVKVALSMYTTVHSGVVED